MAGVAMRARLGVLAAVSSLLVVACGPPDARPEADVVVGRRPADGLLARPELRRIVDLQGQRDGAAIQEYLYEADATVRARAAFALGSVQDTTAAPRLMELLLDLEPRVRADAAFALGQLPMEGLATPLFNALKVEWDRGALFAQIEAVGKRCEPAAARRLFQVVGETVRAAVDRAMARCVLAGVGGDDMWSRLAEDLTHPDPAVREWAAYAFGRHPDPGAWRSHRLAVRRALAGYEADDRAAMHLLRALGRARDSLSWEILGWWLRNGSLWQSRANAAEALGRQDLAAALSRLLPAVEDPSVHVRLMAVQGLGSSPPGPVTIEALLERFRGHPDDVATNGAILELLARVGVGEPLEAWFNRPDLQDEPVLLAGVRGAAALEGERGVELLARVARTPSRRASAAAMAELEARWDASRRFVNSRSAFFEILADLAREGDERVSRAAVELLRDTVFEPLGAPEVVAEVEAARGEPDPRVQRARRPYRSVDWERLRELGSEPRLHLRTNRGTVVLALNTEEAPLTVDGITSLAEAGLYEGVPFHRVVPNFVAQGGDVSLSGLRDPAPFTLRSEFTRTPYGRGVLGMASAGKDTETSQYFVTHSPQPHLDGGYTAFGWVVEGMEVLDAIAPEDRVLRAWVVPGN
jgi:peptidylprolyl isomerase